MKGSGVRVPASALRCSEPKQVGNFGRPSGRAVGRPDEVPILRRSSPRVAGSCKPIDEDTCVRVSEYVNAYGPEADILVVCQLRSDRSCQAQVCLLGSGAEIMGRESFEAGSPRRQQSFFQPSP